MCAVICKLSKGQTCPTFHPTFDLRVGRLLDICWINVGWKFCAGQTIIKHFIQHFIQTPMFIHSLFSLFRKNFKMATDMQMLYPVVLSELCNGFSDDERPCRGKTREWIKRRNENHKHLFFSGLNIFWRLPL